VVFRVLLERGGETGKVPAEVGVRLGQVSEFALFIAVLAQEVEVISARAGYLLQLTTIVTFIASSYYIMLRYPTPIAVTPQLRRD